MRTEIIGSVETLQFAHDQLLITKDEDDVIYIAWKLDQESGKWRLGLDISLSKTKYLCVGRTGEWRFGTGE